MIRASVHILIVIVLTLLTQIGGVVWLLVFGICRIKKWHWSKRRRGGIFIVSYLLVTLILIPPLAKLGGRIPLPLLKTGSLVPHNLMTPLLNRHYVRPELKIDLLVIADQMHRENPELKVSYLDANFPFLDGFPLLPHLSHNDGKKVDLAFYYRKKGKIGNHKPSVSGYGKYVHPQSGEHNQNHICKSKGYWQYDFPKYLTLGSRRGLDFDAEHTKRLIQLIIEKQKTKKLFIEPHLKTRLGLKSDKIRFQGCRAVRHDDHIHYQI